MAKCPYCEYETPEPDDGDATTRSWQEIAHMTLDHPDVLKERMDRLGVMDTTSRFGEGVN
jgi:hypothetical protein